MMLFQFAASVAIVVSSSVLVVLLWHLRRLITWPAARTLLVLLSAVFVLTALTQVLFLALVWGFGPWWLRAQTALKLATAVTMAITAKYFVGRVLHTRHRVLDLIDRGTEVLP